MTRAANNGHGKYYHLEIDPALIERDRRKTEQKNEEWLEQYKIRSGIEATMSELKRVTGLGKLRVRRMSRVTLAVGFKVIACNVKRWLRGSVKESGARRRRGLSGNERGFCFRGALRAVFARFKRKFENISVFFSVPYRVAMAL